MCERKVFDMQQNSRIIFDDKDHGGGGGGRRSCRLGSSGWQLEVRSGEKIQIVIWILDYFRSWEYRQQELSNSKLVDGKNKRCKRGTVSGIQ